ncbi:hypothetical protein FGG08_007157 [Glutinoglossum americanum]|uniref:Transmembrane protein n=1 Tax=Glutinoglossum americanum TaxID=1670608 RepID=A0A9P8I223_9PEZI|nr:hypothetical protein FGG08_007157 [Glutinoglossum americanum]
MPNVIPPSTTVTSAVTSTGIQASSSTPAFKGATSSTTRLPTRAIAGLSIAITVFVVSAIVCLIVIIRRKRAQRALSTIDSPSILDIRQLPIVELGLSGGNRNEGIRDTRAEIDTPSVINTRQPSAAELGSSGRSGSKSIHNTAVEIDTPSVINVRQPPVAELGLSRWNGSEGIHDTTERENPSARLNHRPLLRKELPVQSPGLNRTVEPSCDPEVYLAPQLPPTLSQQTRQALVDELREVEAEEARLLELGRVSRRKRELQEQLGSRPCGTALDVG